MFESELKAALDAVEKAGKQTRLMVVNPEAVALRERICNRLNMVREDLEALDRAVNPK